MSRYVSAYFSPDRQADDIIVGFIDGTPDKLDLAIYSLTHDRIADAVIRAHQRGVKVRLLMDKTQAGNRYADDERIAAAGVEVRLDRVTGSMHNKYIIGASREGGRAVLTGSHNMTKNAVERNAENFAVIRLQYVAREYQANFDHLWEINAPEES